MLQQSQKKGKNRQINESTMVNNKLKNSVMPCCASGQILQTICTNAVKRSDIPPFEGWETTTRK